MLEFIRGLFAAYETIDLKAHRIVVFGKNSEIAGLNSKLNAANDKVSDLTAANKNLQTNIETYQAERDKLHVRIDAAIKALQL